MITARRAGGCVRTAARAANPVRANGGQIVGPCPAQHCDAIIICLPRNSIAAGDDMEHSAAIQSKPKTPPPDEAWPLGLRDDPHWELAQRVVTGPHFARSPLMSKFLLFVV